MAVGGHLHSPAAWPPGKGPDTQCTGGSVGPRVAEDFAPTGIQSLDSPVHSESLYRPSSPGPNPKPVSVANLHFRHMILQVYLIPFVDAHRLVWRLLHWGSESVLWISSRNASTGTALLWDPYLHVRINHLKPTGHVMHHQFNIQQLYALSTLYLCVLYLSENKQRLVLLTA